MSVGRWIGLSVMLAACGRVGFDESAVDGAIAIDAAIDAAPLAWQTPTTLPELASDGAEEDPTFTADRLVIVWTSSRSGGAGSYDLWMAARPTTTAPFTDIRHLTELDTAGYDGSPELTPDGLTLYYSTDPGATADIYVATRGSRTAAWNPPALRTDLSNMEGEYELAISPDGLTAMVDRDTGFYELSRPDTASPFVNVMAHPELGTAGDIASPTIDNGARVVYFHQGVERDLYVARRTGPGAFDTPTPVVELDTADRDADPFITGDERHMLYACGTGLCESERR